MGVSTVESGSRNRTVAALVAAAALGAAAGIALWPQEMDDGSSWEQVVALRCLE